MAAERQLQELKEFLSSLAADDGRDQPFFDACIKVCFLDTFDMRAVVMP